MFMGLMERMRDIVIEDEEVFVVDTVNTFDNGWETMLSPIDVRLIEKMYYDGWDEDAMEPFDLSFEETRKFICEWGEDVFELYDCEYEWQGQKTYRNFEQAKKGHERACRYPKHWIIMNN